MAGLMIAKLASLAVLFAAPLAQASPSDARSCGLCWETATNQAHTPVCTGIFDDAALAECLCAAGNQAIFNTCETACAGTDSAPSTVCSAPGLVQRESQSCVLCWETATNQAHNPICTGLNDDDTAACLCKQGNREIFNTCNTQCKGFPKYMPKNTCRKVAARADDHTCASCWDAEIAERCPGIENEFAQEICVCSPWNAPDFIKKCDPACANSVVKPSDACPKLGKRDAQGESIIPWKHEGDDGDDNYKRQITPDCPGGVPKGACNKSPATPATDHDGPLCGPVPKSWCLLETSPR